MPWKNLGPGTLHLPSGKAVKPGATFSKSQAEGVNTRALQQGKAIKWVKKAAAATEGKK